MRQSLVKHVRSEGSPGNLLFLRPCGSSVAPTTLMQCNCCRGGIKGGTPEKVQNLGSALTSRSMTLSSGSLALGVGSR